MSSPSNEDIKMLMKHDILKNIVLNNNHYIQETIRLNLEKVLGRNIVPRAMSRLEQCCDDSQTEFLMNLIKYYTNNLEGGNRNVNAICFAVLLFYYHSVLLELGLTTIVDSRDPRFKVLPIYSEMQKVYIDITIGNGKGAQFVRRSILGFVDLPDVSANEFDTVAIPIPDYDNVRTKIVRREEANKFWKGIGRKRSASEFLEEGKDTWTGGKKKRKSRRMKSKSKRNKSKRRKSIRRRK